MEKISSEKEREKPKLHLPYAAVGEIKKSPAWAKLITFKGPHVESSAKIFQSLNTLGFFLRTYRPFFLGIFRISFHLHSSPADVFFLRFSDFTLSLFVI